MGLFGKASKRELEDSDFGRLTEETPRSWLGNAFQLWGSASIQIMIDAGKEGPSADQRSFVRSLRTNEEVRARIEQTVAKQARDTTRKSAALHLTSIYFPPSPSTQVWRLWFDMEGEEDYSFGAEIEGLNRIIPFAED